MSLLALRDGEVVRRQHCGMADLETSTPVTALTNFRLASLTKQFTAAAVLRLAGSGRLSLQERASRFLPSLPEQLHEITIEHLLTHTSGVVDYEDLIPAEMTSPLNDAEVLRLIAAQPSTYFRPGTSYRYSNGAYALLALIVEQAASLPFADLLRRDLFDPLDMQGTVAHQEGISPVAHRAYGYSRERDGWIRTDQNLTSAVLGDGGVYSSAEDLSKWLTALDGGAFAEAAVPRVVTDIEGVRYGYGWRVSEHRGRPIVHHSGESIGFRNAVVRCPAERFSVVVLTNRDDGLPMEIALGAMEEILEHPRVRQHE